MFDFLNSKDPFKTGIKNFPADNPADERQSSQYRKVLQSGIFKSQPPGMPGVKQSPTVSRVEEVESFQPHNPKWKLEKQYQKAYTDWKERNDPESRTEILKALDPVMDKGLQMYGGRGDLDKNRAKLIALKSLQTYDPEKAKLQSHLLNHLKALHRQKNQQLLHIPERQILAAKSMREATAELEAELGRDPTDEELLARLKWSDKQLQKIRKYDSSYMSGQFSDVETGGEDVATRIPGDSGLREAWVQIVYDDLSETDKLILEHSLGLNNKKKLSNQELAKKLRMTPGAVSQRKAKIQAMLDQEEELSPFKT
jgi:DNA-directed RNA polymerase specialized sigma subunit